MGQFGFRGRWLLFVRTQGLFFRTLFATDVSVRFDLRRQRILADLGEVTEASFVLHVLLYLLLVDNLGPLSLQLLDTSWLLSCALL